MIGTAKEVIRGVRISSRLFVRAVRSSETPKEYDFGGPMGKTG